MLLFKLAEILQEARFSKNGLCTVQIDGRKITLAKKGDRLFAFSSSCPHAGHDMANGYLDSKNCVVCPLHHYRFSLSNGFDTTGEGYHLRMYKTRKLPDGWYIEMPSALN